ncbi:MAG: hypothetical protein ACRDD8_15465 [Bacteroidales bacterium]
MATTEEIIKSLNDSFFAYLTSVNPTLKPDSLEYKAIQGWCNSFSTSIGSAIEGGTSGVIPSDYLKKAGDGMIGKLSANYGFEAGAKNGIISLSVIDRQDIQFIVANSDIDLIGKSILYNGENLIGVSSGSIIIGGGLSFTNIDFGSHTVSGIASINVANKLLVSGSSFAYGGFDVYHSGNSNLNTIDWSALNINAAGNLVVSGDASFGGSLSSNGGFLFSINSKSVFSHSVNGELESYVDLFIKNNSKLLFNSGKSFIFESEFGDLSLKSNRLLLLEAGSSGNIRLMSTLSSFNGELGIIDKFGKGNFLRGCDLGVNDISVLSSVSYGANISDKGIEVLNFIKFKGINTGIMSSSDNSIAFVFGANSAFGVSKTNGFVNFSTTSSLNNERYRFDKDVLCDTKFAVFNSASNATATYLGDKILYLGDNGDSTGLIGHYLMNNTNGMTVNGDLLMDNFSIRNLNFSEGISGTGVGIDFTKSTITADFLVVRKKFRVVEFEIQKTTTTNGDLVVSSSCSGDYVTEII